MAADKKSGTGCPPIRKKSNRVVSVLLFILYFIILFYFLFFSEEMGRTYSERVYHYNLIPFYEIKRFLTHYEVLGMEAVLLNIVGNVMAFFPFGMYLPWLSRRCQKFWYTAFYSFELSLIVELIQLITKVGSFDVDDIILNTLGGILGYLLYLFYMFLWKKKNSRR